MGWVDFEIELVDVEIRGAFWGDVVGVCDDAVHLMWGMGFGVGGVGCDIAAAVVGAGGGHTP